MNDSGSWTTFHIFSLWIRIYEKWWCLVWSGLWLYYNTCIRFVLLFFSILILIIIIIVIDIIFGYCFDVFVVVVVYMIWPWGNLVYFHSIIIIIIENISFSDFFSRLVILKLLFGWFIFFTSLYILNSYVDPYTYGFRDGHHHQFSMNDIYSYYYYYYWKKNICKAFLLTPRDIIDSIFFSQYDWSKTERRRKKRFLSIDIFMVMMMTMNWMKGISFWKMKIVKFLCKEFLPYCCRCLKVKYEGSGCSLVVVVVVVELNRTWKFINGIQESKEPYHPFIIYIVFIYSVSWWFHLGNGKLSSMIKQIKTKNKTECY